METPGRHLCTAIRDFLPDLLHLVDAEIVQDLDLSRITFPRRSAATADELSLAARVRSRDGQQVTVMVQVVTEPLRHAGIAHRIQLQAGALGLRLCDPVLPAFVLLRGGRPGINLEVATIANFRDWAVLRLYFLAFGLQGSNATYYLDRPEPLAWAMAAFMSSPRHSPAELRRACLRRIRRSHLDAASQRLLALCVSSRLPPRSPQESPVKAARAVEARSE
jgi:hypothetical protein